DHVQPLAGHAPDAHGRAGARQVRGLRALSPDLPGELHQAGARRGRAGESVSPDLRNRRVPLRVLRLLPGSLPRRGDSRRLALRERGILARSLRLRPRAALCPDPSGVHAVGPGGSEGRMTPTTVVFWFFAVLALGSAVLCISRRSPVSSALWLVVTMFSLAVLFAIL